MQGDVRAHLLCVSLIHTYTHKHTNTHLAARPLLRFQLAMHGRK